MAHYSHVYSRLPRVLPWLVMALGLAVGAAACSSDSDDSDSGDSGGSGGATAGSGGGTATGGTAGGSTCANTCDDEGQGCPNIVCNCSDGTVINTTYCNNGCCEPAENTCPDACADNGGWAGGGTAGTGGGTAGTGGGTAGTGGGGEGADIGEECEYDDDCLSNTCLFAGDAQFGFCSKVCDSWSDCPSFWNCESVGNASAKYCVPGE